jgi:class III poly(R)-hydroxyalkanoic acid synthase PhaE subunit
VNESLNPNWMEQWQAFARQYMNTWQDMARGTQMASALPAQDSNNGFAQWSRWFTAGVKQNETIDRLIDSAKNYTAFMQTMLATTAAGKGDGTTWTDALKQVFVPQMSAMFEHPLAQMWQMGQGGDNSLANGFVKTMNALGAWRAPPELGDIKEWMNLPTFGYPREHQERYQKMAAAWIDYQEQMHRYQALMFKVAQRGFEIFEGKLTEREQPGRQIESLRALYDLWVDAVEEGHAEIALSTEFREVYGALTDAQMRVRALIQHEVERVCASLGRPTRSEIDSIGERLQALRREVRANGSGGGGSTGDIAALRAEVETLKAGLKSARTVPPPSAGDPTGDIAALRAQIQAIKDDLKSARIAPPSSGSATATRAAPPPRALPVRHAGAATRSTAPAPKRPKKPLPKSVRSGPNTDTRSAASFASRIARFANASLGATHPPEKRSGKPGKKKH